MPTVLLVEDDPALLKVFSRILASDKYELIAVDGAAAALEAASKHEVTLLVTDQQLDVHRGTELATVLRGQFPSLEVLILTGDPNAVKGFPVMAKPFEIDALVSAIHDTIMRVTPQR